METELGENLLFISRMRERKPVIDKKLIMVEIAVSGDVLMSRVFPKGLLTTTGL